MARQTPPSRRAGVAPPGLKSDTDRRGRPGTKCQNSLDEIVRVDLHRNY